MPWEETNGMRERLRFIASYLEAGGPFSCVCERYEVSRKTGYKWVERYESDGVAGLEERSRAPLSHPHAVANDVVEKILRIRKGPPALGTTKVACPPAAALSATRSAGCDSNRQRSAVLDSCARRTVEACRLVDSARNPP
jgi:transposase-like protein